MSTIIDHEWIRVTEDCPCPVCGHTDWDLLHITGQRAICCRTPARLYVTKYAGYEHFLHDYQLKPGFLKHAKKRRAVPINWYILTQAYQNNLALPRLEQLAVLLGVTINSLVRLGAGWDGEAYTFPMYNSHREVVGIHRRFPDGSKKVVYGSHLGLFIPLQLSVSCECITEGLSDTAAAVDMGFHVYGRPSCDACNDMVSELITDGPILIIADNDLPGMRGACRLERQLKKAGHTVKIIVPQEKDLRKQLNVMGVDKCREWIQKQIE